MKPFFLFLMLMLLFFGGFANGGPVDACAVYRTGDIELINIPNIKLLKEDLKIRIEHDYSYVDVTYWLKNDGFFDTDSVITYGFPVDYIYSELGGFKWKNDYVPEIEFRLNSQKLNIKHQVDYSIIGDRADDKKVDSIELKRSWYVVDFKLDDEKVAVLNIRYKIKNGFEDWGTTKNFFPTFDKRHFRYDFKPAMHWSDGIVPELNVAIDVRQIRSAIKDFHISGMRFIDSAGIYKTSLKNYNLAKAPNLNISYSDINYRMSRYAIDYRLKKEDIKSVTVSSSLSSSYLPKNMFDFDFATVWAEGNKGNGIGETIEIKLDKYPLGAIGIINGYTKNEKLYKQNSRIKKLRLNIEYVNYKDTTKREVDTQEIELKDLDYKTISTDNYWNMVTLLGDYGEGYNKVTKITLTILDVYKGTSYSDVCISEILLLGYR